MKVTTDVTNCVILTFFKLYKLLFRLSFLFFTKTVQALSNAQIEKYLYRCKRNII